MNICFNCLSFFLLKNYEVDKTNIFYIRININKNMKV